MDSSPDHPRQQLLVDLVEFRGAPARLARELAEFPWDWEGEPLAHVVPRDVRRVLGGFTNGELGEHEVEAWADAIEVREDLDFEPPAVRSAIHVLANPLLEGRLTPNLAARLTATLVERYPCPCCGYSTLSEQSPSDEICKVCFWQDDFVDNQDVSSRGPNRVSLSTARANFDRIGACEERFVDAVRGPREDEGPPTPWTEAGSRTDP
ncbi:MAG: CPCC family cysteine-rich protein [Solirubrobacterales bacterium]